MKFFRKYYKGANKILRGNAVKYFYLLKNDLKYFKDGSKAQKIIFDIKVC